MRVVGKAGKHFRYGTELVAKFEFAGRVGEDSYPSISSAQQEQFQAEFARQFEKVRDQLAKYSWLSSEGPLPPRVVDGPYQPPSDFHVFVSEAYSLSKSLVPSWFGQRGWMEFPAYRVVAGQASVAHELVHVLFPNGNRMLAEGLAVYLQYKLFPDIPVYPNFAAPLEALVEDFLSARSSDAERQAYALWNMDLDGLERISTPDELSLRIGRDPIVGSRLGGPPAAPEDGKFLYGLAGSLVGFLLENPIGDGYDFLNEANFGALYQSTPLRPLDRDSGAPNRWQTFYRDKNASYTFNDLCLLWKTYMHFELFSGGAQEIPIPDDFREKQLVVQLCKRLKNMTGQSAAKHAARRRLRRGK